LEPTQATMVLTGIKTADECPKALPPIHHSSFTV
jgi:hypothetical protein